MKAKEFDNIFHAGGNIIKHLDISKAKRGGQEIKRVNVDLPAWMLHSLDKEASRLGITRQAVVKFLLARHFNVA